MTWRFHAYRITGRGTETALHHDLPLSDVTITEDLSGPGELSAKITPELVSLKGDDGNPLLLPWGTAIYPELDGVIRGGFILEDRSVHAESLSLKAPGFRGYLTSIPYSDVYSAIQVDPLDAARRIWNHVQGKRGGNLDLTLDATTSPVRIGEEEDTEAATTQGGEAETGPYQLNWWSTDDLGKEFDDLAAETPFDYRISHKWSGETVSHHLHLGYPTIGKRRTDLRLVVGENILELPELADDGAEYASEILLLGAGEGKDMIRGVAATTPPRLRRVKVVTDKSVRSKKRANRLAEAELRLAGGGWEFEDFIMRDHPNAPIGAMNVGDEVRVHIPAGWNAGVDVWMKVLSIAWSPQSDRATIKVRRSEKL